MSNAAMLALNLVPRWALALVAAAALVGAGVNAYKLNTERAAHAQTVAAFATYTATAERLSREAEASRHIKENELKYAQDTHAIDVGKLNANLARARATAGAAADRLRDAASAAADRARAQCADTTAADLGAPADDLIGVLADVLGRADERAGALAEIADARGIAGNACARAYDTAREALKAD